LLAGLASLCVLALLCPAGSLAQGSTGCGYGTGGAEAGALCWLNMSGYDDAQARMAAGQRFSLSLPGGYTVSFTVHTTDVPDHMQAALAAVKFPTWNDGAYIGNHAYRDTPGLPALYMTANLTSAAFQLKLSDIKVRDPLGTVSGFGMVAADAESTTNGESMSFTASRPLSRVDIPVPNYPACTGGLTGIGTNKVDCLGGPLTSIVKGGALVVRTDFQANTPDSISVTATSGKKGKEGVAFAVVYPVPELTLSMSPSAIDQRRLDFTLKGAVENAPESQPVTITTSLPQGMTVADMPSGKDWDCTKTVVGSSQVSCTYTPTGPITAGSKLPPITLPTLLAADATGQLKSTATISSSDNGSSPERSTATWIGDAAGADVYVRIEAPSPVRVDQSAVVTVTVGNNGPANAQGVEVSIPVPSGKVLSVPSDCRVVGSTIMCTIDKLTASNPVRLQLKVTSRLAGRRELFATVTDRVPDINMANNEASAAATVMGPQPPPADRTDATLSPKPAPRTDNGGAPVTLSWVARNAGPANATGVEVVITLPPGATLISAPAGCNLHGGVVICRIGDLAKGASRTVSVTFKPSGAGLNQAFATMRTDQIDARPRNEEASEETSVRRKPTPAPPPHPPPPVTG
jgi:uncharacterized repeat protein (TIGR01451 family)